MTKWESEKHKSWSMPVEDNVTTDGSLQGNNWKMERLWLGSGTAGL